METWPKLGLKVFGFGENGGKTKMNRVRVRSAIFKKNARFRAYIRSRGHILIKLKRTL
jgi:hypothetical protein